jgi:HKD family nuclease
MDETTLITKNLVEELKGKLANEGLQGVDIVCSYVKLSGVGVLKDLIQSLSNRRIPIRLIATRQHGITEFKASEKTRATTKYSN